MTNRYSRRAFLATTGATGVATVLARADGALAGSRGASTGRSPMAAVASLHRSTFEALLGSKFRLSDGPDAQTLVLEDVADLRPGGSGSPEGRFSLLFRGAKSTPWEQGTYDLHHRAIGKVRLLVVPVDRGVKAHRYQVVVNRA
ncbi:MAG TPA: hypothetical protein VID47_08820 [Actinomycetota bacterium]|jgi:hypothetical protein